MILFYDTNVNLGEFELNSEESHHAINVMRKKVGDEIWVTNGKGVMVRAVIKELKKHNLTLETIDFFEDYKKRNYYLHIAIAPTKNIDRFEWFLEKATELGIDEITPILCANSERKIIKPDRLNKVIEAAMKQSCKAYHPKLNALEDIKSFINKNTVELRYIAHCVDSEKNNLTINLQKAEQKNLVLVGPEGDFNSQEISIALKNQFIPVALGKERLRTETAGVYVASVFNHYFSSNY